MAEDQASEAMAAPAGDLQLAIRSAPAPSAAIHQTDRSEFRLLDLPVELQDVILEYLVLSSDMKSACLACKRFQVFFTPLLYRHMEIDGDYVLDGSFARSLTENHHGLKHVRTLRIRDPKTLMDICELSGRTIPRTLYPEYNIIEEQMGRAICRFLDAMPTHSLTRLELPMYYCKSTDIERNVRLSQHALTHHQFRANGSKVLQILTPKTDYLTLVTTLQLYLKFEDDYKHTIFLLESTPNLVSLDVEVLMDRPEYIFRTPLAGGPRSLKSLRLECFYFENGGTTLFNMVRFEELEELQLFFCKDYGCLLLELTHLPLKLKSFVIDEQNTLETQFDHNANTFLGSLKPLDRLVLALDADIGGLDTPIDWSAIEIHAPTLKYLKVEINWVPEMFPTKECVSSFERLCKSAVNLEQLAISGVCPGSDPDDEDANKKLAIGRFVDCVAEVPSLRVLKLDVDLGIRHFDDDDDHKFGSPRSRSQLDARAIERQRMIQNIINWFFWHLEFACPDLAAVVLGVYGEEDEDEGVHPFLRSTPIEVDGRIGPVGVPVKRHMVKYHEPCSEILEREAFEFTKMRPALELRDDRTIPWARNNT